MGVHNLTYGKIGYGGDAGSFRKGGVSCVCGEGGLHMLALGTIV
jgi:hypothetical protein